MSSEAQIRSSININAQGNAAPLVWNPGVTSFNVDVSSAQAPTPGNVRVTPAGCVIDISKILTQPGLAHFFHLGTDSLNFVSIGIHNGIDFYPFIDLLAGESWKMRLSRNILQEYAGSATVSGLPAVSLYAKSALAVVNINAEVIPL